MGKFKRILVIVLSLVMALSMMAPAASAATGVILDADVSAANRQLSREIAAECMVLLKNDNGALPLKQGEKVALFGGAGDKWKKGGNGSGDVQISNDVIIDAYEGLQQMQNQGRVQVTYHKNDDGISQNDANSAKNSGANTAIVVIMRNSSEGGDTGSGGGSYQLNDNEKNKLTYVSNAGFENIIVVLNAARVIDMSWIKQQNYIDSILIAGQGGVWGGLALADVLVGDVTPSGKTTDTWVDSYDSYPTSNNFFRGNGFNKDTQGFNNHTWYTDYTEDIYMGYRYFETFAPDKVLYEFGYGLSYTTFSLKNQKVNVNGDTIEVSVDVTNTGNYSGKEVVQVYFSAPQGVLGKPAKELAAFQKTDLLAPGATQTVKMSFSVDSMASYDDTGKTGHESAYVLEAGTYAIYVGTSIRQVTQAGSYNQSALEVTQQLTEQAAPLELEWRAVNNNGTLELEAVETYDQMDEAPIDGFVTLNTNGTTRIEAENPWFKSRYSRSEFNGSDCLLRFEGESADPANGYIYFDYGIYVPEDGQYDLRLGVGRTAGDRTVEIYLDGQCGTGTRTGTITVKNTGGEKTIKDDHGTVRLNLTKGNHIIDIRFPDKGDKNGRFDYITLQAVNSGTYTLPANPYAQDIPDPAQDHGITFMDLANDIGLLDDFVDQLSYDQLRKLSAGNGGSNNTGLDQAQGTIGGIEQFQIPKMQVSDGPAGVDFTKDGGQTAWPVDATLACSWDPALLEKEGVAFGNECKTVGVDLILTPGINLHRNPLGGRVFEYFSEDPLLTGIMSGALIRGIESTGTTACVKHFVGNERENDRVWTETRVSERALRELYLEAFRVCIEEGDPAFLMTSYNRVNGTYTSESVDLCTNILRDEWGYEGTIVTDWWNSAEQVLEINAGGNVKMQNEEGNLVVPSLQHGRLSRDVVMESVKYTLKGILSTGALERQLNSAPVHAVTATGTVTVPAVEYAWASENIGSEESDDANITQCPTNTYGGQSMTYYLDVEKAGTYNMMIRVASPGDGGVIDITGDGVALASYTNNSGSTNWHDWKDSSNIKLVLPEGRTELKLTFPGGSVNVLYFNLTRVNNGSITVSPTDGSVSQGKSLQMQASDSNVTWSVKGNKSANTKIDANGKLTIGADETVSSVVVYATSKTNADLVGAVHVRIRSGASYVLMGDVNGDGFITIYDILGGGGGLGIKELILSETPTAEQLAAGDMNGNDVLDASDLLLIKMLLLAQ